MYRSTLIEYLKKFTPKETREFNEFVHSPFFNKNKSVIKLYEYIRKHHHSLDSSRLEKRYVFKKIFHGVEYNNDFMKTLMFNLQKLIEDYFVYTGLKEHHFKERVFLLRKLNRKGLNRQVERKMRELMKEFECVKVRERDYYYDKLIAETERYNYLIRVHHDRFVEFMKPEYFNDMANDLTIFYILHAIQQYGIILNVQKAYQIDLKAEQFKHIIMSLKPSRYLNVPLLNLYYNIMMLSLKEDDVSYFYKVMKIADNNDGCLARDHLVNAYTCLENYCKRMIWKGKNEFVRELFDIYKMQLERKLYSFQKEMTVRFYRGIVKIALKFKEFDWAKEFIEKYKCELSPDSQQDTYSYSLALYEFALKNFEKSLELLSKVKYTDIDHKILLRCLLTSLYYELKMEDSLLSHIDSFHHFLSNDKLITPERKERFANFIKYTKNLNGLKNRYDEQELKCLKQRILDDLTVYNKEWLVEKISELEEK